MSKPTWEYPGEWTDNEKSRGWKMVFPINAKNGLSFPPDLVDSIEEACDDVVKFMVALWHREHQNAARRREKLN